MSTTRRLLSVAILLLASAFAEPASAQSCEGGRVSTSGYCCWPGQRWSTQARACEGPPVCPAGMVAEGATCLAGQAGVVATPLPPVDLVPEAAVEPQPILPPLTWPETAGPRPDALVDPEIRRGTDEGLIIAGLVTFGVGYLLGLGMAGWEQEQQWCSTYVVESRFLDRGVRVGCDSWPLALLPLAGGIASSQANFVGPGQRLDCSSGRDCVIVDYPSSRQVDGGWIWIQGIAATVQVTGLLIVLGALLGHTEDLVEPAAGDGWALRLLPSAPGSDAGGSMTLLF